MFDSLQVRKNAIIVYASSNFLCMSYFGVDQKHVYFLWFLFVLFVGSIVGDGEDMRVIIISEYHIRIGRRILRDLILGITINHTLFIILREMSFLFYACHNPTYNRNILDIRFPQLIASIYH